MTVKKTVDQLIRTTTREAKHGSTYCHCGSCRQAVFQADEIIQNEPRMNCPVWVMQVAAAMFIRASDEVQLIRGGDPAFIQDVFYGMVEHAHRYGMNHAKAHIHFDADRVTKNPRKDRS